MGRKTAEAGPKPESAIATARQQLRARLLKDGRRVRWCEYLQPQVFYEVITEGLSRAGMQYGKLMVDQAMTSLDSRPRWD